MATQLQIRRGTTAQMNAFTGAEGELAVNTSTDTLHVHNGATAGGFALARADGSNIATYAGSFTTLAASSTATLNTLASSGATLTGGTINGMSVGATTASTGSFTTIAASGAITGNVTGNLTGSVLTAAQTNITSVGTLSSLAVTGALTVDTNTLVVDATNNRVGIGTSSPSSSAGWGTLLEVSGTTNAGIKLTETDTANGDYSLGVTAGTFRIWDETASAFRLTLDGSGRVGIGTSSPSSYFSGATNLVLSGTGDSGLTINSGTSNLGRIHFADGTSGADQYRGYIVYQHTDNSMQFATNSLERMRIDSAGNVGIGIANPSAYAAKNLVIAATDEEGITIVSDPAHQGYLMFADGTSGSQKYRGYLGYDHNNDNLNVISSGTMKFYSGDPATERMRIDSSGRLLVGTTGPSAAGTTAKLQVNSEILSVGSSSGIFWTNRNNTVTGGTNWAGWYSTSANHFLYSENANVASIGRTSGTYTALSDVNKKKDFEDSTVGLDAVMQLKPKTYRMLKDADDAPKHLGFIAQEIEHIIPEAYVESTSVDAGGIETTFIGLTDRPFIAALTKAVQEQQATIESQAAAITDLTTRLTALENN